MIKAFTARVCLFSLTALALLFQTTLLAQQENPWDGYLTFAEIEGRLKQLAESPQVELESLGKTIEGRDLWLLKLAERAAEPQDESSETAQYKPAILILGNVHAPHLVGREVALRMAEQLVRDANEKEEVKRLLEQFTIYFIPVPSPDAAEKNLQRPFREITGNATPTDDDRDFSTGEDPSADLNEDGWITMLRVHDTFGTHRSHPGDPRVLIEVDRKANEQAEFRLYTESRDADDDEQFGEDGADGVDFNRNFTFNYSFFGKGSGPNQVSEIETRAIADFAFDHPNIGVVFCFSPEDNLFHPWKGSPQNDNARIKTSILSADVTYTDFLAKAFQKSHGGKDAPASPKGSGSFSEWAYFHYGRWSFASRAWWVPAVKAPLPERQEKSGSDSEKPDSKDAVTEGADPSAEAAEAAIESAAEAVQEAETVKPPVESGGENARPPRRGRGERSAENRSVQGSPTENSDANTAKDEKRGKQDIDALAWFAENNIPGFVDWTPIEHPNFPDAKVEVGGFKPFYRLNPPAAQIDGLVQPHLDLLFEIEKVWPALEIREFTATELAAGVYHVKCKVYNKGFLPTMPSIGQVTQQAYPIQVTLDVPVDAKWIQGSRRQRVGRLDGLGGSEELEWIFQLAEPLAKDSEITLSTWSPTLHSIEVKTPIKQ